MVGILDTCDKYNVNDEGESSKPWKVYQTMNNGSRWAIMTSNGSESLNNIFKTSHRFVICNSRMLYYSLFLGSLYLIIICNYCKLSLAAIIEETFYKCITSYNLCYIYIVRNQTKREKQLGLKSL